MTIGEGADMIVTMQLRIFSWSFLLKVQSMKIPIEATAGISARVKHTTEFVIFLDYDNMKDKRLVEELRYLQELFGLGDFIVASYKRFRSTRNLH